VFVRHLAIERARQTAGEEDNRLLDTVIGKARSARAAVLTHPEVLCAVRHLRHQRAKVTDDLRALRARSLTEYCTLCALLTERAIMDEVLRRLQDMA